MSMLSRPVSLDLPQDANFLVDVVAASSALAALGADSANQRRFRPQNSFD